MWRFTERLHGQATVEAAYLIPILLAGVLLMIQPAVILFDRAVMESVAVEACRVMETLSPSDQGKAKLMVQRRLMAVPDADLFHMGTWDVQLKGDETQEVVSVSIAHDLKLLPGIGAGMRLVGLAAPGGVYHQEVAHEASVHDRWVVESASGLDPQAWVDRWEEKV